MSIPITVLLWFSILSCGLLAGLYFAFSAFIMTALGRLDGAAGRAAMNAINADILRSAFMPLFLGSTLSCLALVLLALADLERAGAAEMLAGGLIHVFGMTGVTMAFNVPLNGALAEAAADEAEAAWRRYRRDWTRWNHVRTLASAAAFLLLVRALAVS